MATLEERMTCVEHEVARVDHENAELKKSVELLNIALGALVNKATLEKVNEQNGKIFDALMRHDQFTNQQLAELREQLTEQGGKIVGLQTEMRQEVVSLRGELRQEVVGLRTEMRQGFAELRQEFAEVKQDVGGIYAQLNGLEKLLIDRLPPAQ